MSKFRKERKAYIRYSEEQIQRARDTDMVNYLERVYGFTFHRAGRYYICDEHNSLNVEYDRTTWHWNSRNTGGLNVITWLQNIEGYSFQEALKLIVGDGEDLSQKPRPAFKKTEKIVEEKKPFVLPKPLNDKFSQVFMYLTKTRCISPDIVTHCFHEKIIYQEKEHNNAVFVGYDENKVAKFAEARSSLSGVQFRMNISGSDKRYSFNIPATADDSIKDRVFVFEAPIDLLSHATLNQINAKKHCEEKNLPYNPDCWKKHNRLSLSGSSDIALDSYVKRHPEIKKIAVCVDNDEAGQKLSKSIYEKYTALGYTVSIHNASNGKDYNDMLCALKKPQENNIINTVNESQLSR